MIEVFPKRVTSYVLKIAMCRLIRNNPKAIKGYAIKFYEKKTYLVFNSQNTVSYIFTCSLYMYYMHVCIV